MPLGITLPTIALAISSACAGMHEYRACSKALEAFTKQTGIWQASNKLNKYVSDYVGDRLTAAAKSAAPPILWQAAAVGATVYEVGRGKEYRISFKPPVLSVTSAYIGAGTRSVSSGLEWRF